MTEPNNVNAKTEIGQEYLQMEPITSRRRSRPNTGRSPCVKLFQNDETKEMDKDIKLLNIMFHALMGRYR